MTTDKRTGIDYIDPKSGKVSRAVELSGAHKVAVTPDGKRLYASGTGDTIYTYSINADHTASGQEVFCKEHCEDLKFTDGIVIDEKGNVYTISDKIFVYNPQGFKIEEIDLPEHSRNIRFAGKDRKTLFICGTNFVYTLEMAVKGPPSALDLARSSGK
jgi:gluconolactonase